MILVRNKDPHMAGQKFVRNGQSFTLDQNGRVLAPEASGLHLCGPDWVVEEGVPKALIVQQVTGGTAVRPLPGPLKIWQGDPAHCAGQLVTARDGTVVRFNGQGFGAAPDNCGLDVVPGYSVVADGTPEQMELHGVTPPTTLKELEDAALEAQLAVYGEEVEEDPYAAFQRELMLRTVRPATEADLAVAQGDEPEAPAIPAEAPKPVPAPAERPKRGRPAGSTATAKRKAAEAALAALQKRTE
jgi:hypothetical protein